MLNAIKHAALPPLAWLARISGREAHALCGTGVRTTPDYLFEGAWAQARVGAPPSDAAEVFGSGLEFKHGRWIAVPPSHLLEGLYVLRGEEWVVSNSLAFLVAQTGLGFLLSGERLLAAFAEAAVAVRDTPVTIPTSEGPLHLLYHHNAVLSEELRPEPKPEAPSFQTFEEYRAYLLWTLSAVRAQCGRAFLTSVSSGYDSVACASLVAALGAREAVTFRTARGGAADSGVPIARALCLDVTEMDRPSSADPRSAALFACAGLGGEDALYAGMSDRLRGRIFVTGFHGDKMWDMHASPNRQLRRRDVSGASLGEFRLRSDFIHIPAPFIGGRRHPELAVISHSEEMRAFSVGGSYDRPLARRIAEEAGVPRRAFGVTKRAVSLRGAGDWSNTLFLARARFAAGVALWRLLHGGARRLGPHAGPPALAAADAIFLRIFAQSFAVFEHAGAQAERPFRAALDAVVNLYRTALERLNTAGEPAAALTSASVAIAQEADRISH